MSQTLEMEIKIASKDEDKTHLGTKSNRFMCWIKPTEEGIMCWETTWEQSSGSVWQNIIPNTKIIIL